MNRRQQGVLLVAAVIICIMTIIPPFNVKVAKSGPVVYRSGYSLLFSPSINDMQRNYPSGNASVRPTIDLPRFLVQYISILTICGLLVLALKE